MYQCRIVLVLLGLLACVNGVARLSGESQNNARVAGVHRVARSPPRACRWKVYSELVPNLRSAVEGCSCKQRFGRIYISCVNLGLTNVKGVTGRPRSPVVLDLSGNNFNHIDDEAIDSDLDIIKLVIRNNHAPSGTLDINIFTLYNLKNLQYVDLTNSSLSRIPIAVWARQNADLRVLKLGYNRITVVEADLARLTKLEVLELEGNTIINLSAWSFRELPLKHLSISLSDDYVRRKSQLDSSTLLPCETNLKQLASLVITNTNLRGKRILLRMLRPNCINSLREFTCENCSLDDGSLNFVDRENGPRFEKINLRHNMLTNQALNGLVKGNLSGYNVPPFLTNLRELDLSNNDLSRLKLENPGRYLPSLEILDLSHNILVLISADFYKLPRLTLLNVKYNRLIRIHMYGANWQLNNLQVLFEGNLFSCDCDAHCMIERAKAQILDGVAGPFSLHDIQQVTCRFPQQRNGSLITSVTLDECTDLSTPVYKGETDSICLNSEADRLD